MVFNELRHNV